jgi:hypothetical protein
MSVITSHNNNLVFSHLILNTSRSPPPLCNALNNHHHLSNYRHHNTEMSSRPLVDVRSLQSISHHHTNHHTFPLHPLSLSIPSLMNHKHTNSPNWPIDTLYYTSCMRDDHTLHNSSHNSYMCYSHRVNSILMDTQLHTTCPSPQFFFIIVHNQLYTSSDYPPYNIVMDIVSNSSPNLHQSQTSNSYKLAHTSFHPLNSSIEWLYNQPCRFLYPTHRMPDIGRDILLSSQNRRVVRYNYRDIVVLLMDL